MTNEHLEVIEAVIRRDCARFGPDALQELLTRVRSIPPDLGGSELADAVGHVVSVVLREYLWRQKQEFAQEQLGMRAMDAVWPQGPTGGTN